MSMIVSFDVGINNISFCEGYEIDNTIDNINNSNKIHITRWIRASISPNTIADTTQAEAVAGLSEFLKKHFDFHDKDYQIIIERQVPLNLKAFVLSYVIMGHFIAMGINRDQIRMWDPRAKPLPLDAQGKKRKKIALVQPVVDALITKRCENAEECIGMYMGEKKKDDMFDAFLQLMAVVGEKGDKGNKKNENKNKNKKVKIKVEKVEKDVNLKIDVNDDVNEVNNVNQDVNKLNDDVNKRQKTQHSPITPRPIEYITID
jgi:hypothetical protein